MLLAVTLFSFLHACELLHVLSMSNAFLISLPAAIVYREKWYI